MTHPRILVISHAFPPAREVGGIRWAELSRLAIERGWEVDVIAAGPAGVGESTLDVRAGRARVFRVAQAKSILTRIAEVILRSRERTRDWVEAVGGKVAIVEAPLSADDPSSIARPHPTRTSAVRRGRNAFVTLSEHMDHLKWCRAVKRVAQSILRAESYSVVLSSAPPHPTHSAAVAIGRSRRIPIVLDFRDPWTFAERLPGHIDADLTLLLARAIEPGVVKAADLVIMNTPLASAAMKRAYPGTEVLSVMNGFDEGFFPPPHPPPDVFRISYAGSIYLDRDPAPLFRAVATVVRRMGLAPGQLIVEFMGNVHAYGGRSIKEIAAECEMGDSLLVHPPGTRDEALAFLSKAQMLVVLPQDSHLAIPAKVFEYMRFSAWILALTVPESSTGRLLSGVEADVVPHDRSDMIEEAILNRLREFQVSGPPEPLGASKEKVSRRAQADILFDRLESLIAMHGVDS